MSKEAEPNVPLVSTIPASLLKIHRAIDGLIHAKLGALTDQQYRLLFFLREAPMTMTEVAQKMGHTTAASTGLVDRLVTAGLVERGSVAGDRRKYLAILTPHGQAVIGAMDPTTEIGKMIAIQLHGHSHLDSFAGTLKYLADNIGAAI